MNNEKKIKFEIKPQEQHWVGDGFFVHTLIHPSAKLNASISPFLLMDYAPPRCFDKTKSKKGVGEHPHRGFETVTFALQGEVEHRDSSGGGGVIGPGDVQWMTAASGLVHEEYHSKNFAEQGGEFEMLQIWVNLPAKDKMTKPRYQGLKKESFPDVDLGGAKASLVAGRLHDKQGPALTHTDINMFQVKVDESKEYKIPLKPGTNTLVLVFKGQLTIGDKSFSDRDLVILEKEGDHLKVGAQKDSRFIVLNGEPIEEPIASYGPFVMNTKQELMQAVDDYNAGKMGKLN